MGEIVVAHLFYFMNTTKYRYRVEYKGTYDYWEEYSTFSHLETAKDHYKRLRPPKRLVSIKTEMEVIDEKSTESEESSDHSGEVE